MGSRWRQESYCRYARMHFDLDSHDAYATMQDDPTRLVPNPAKKKADQQVLAALARDERALATTDAAMLDVVTATPGQGVLITNADPRQAHRLTTGGESLTVTSAQVRPTWTPPQAPTGPSRPGFPLARSTPAATSHLSRTHAMGDLAHRLRLNLHEARDNHLRKGCGPDSAV
jgi:hypothetical protein